jgi:hypothetical protein
MFPALLAYPQEVLHKRKQKRLVVNTYQSPKINIRLTDSKSQAHDFDSEKIIVRNFGWEKNLVISNLEDR